MVSGDYVGSGDTFGERCSVSLMLRVSLSSCGDLFASDQGGNQSSHMVYLYNQDGAILASPFQSHVYPFELSWHP